ncbi:HesA/MoeB/ThiF family protein [Salinimonas chungwhensis]|uniref:HesA/MoeB/ThiF family protein n=1 Tax=Salinimonas chungwhensis TaxID=265425 RepID=UPI00035F3F0F|nr:molybdopterin-synthase adenylyltransferase MoeB [Salinimonas chungwhensis]
MPEPINQAQAMRYNRHIVLPQIDLEGQERLLNARVLIIGAGGLGCSAAQLLCASGVGTLTLVDDDHVEVTNLPRQVLFTDADVGQYKVAAAQQKLNQLNASCQIKTYSRRLDLTELASQAGAHNIVLDCTDNLSARLATNAACAVSRTPLVSGAAIRFEGQLFTTSYAPGTSCYECVSALTGNPDLSCTESGIFSPVVAIIGAQQALIAMQLIAGIGKPLLNTLQLFDALSGQWQQFIVPENPQCTVCQG